MITSGSSFQSVNRPVFLAARTFQPWLLCLVTLILLALAVSPVSAGTQVMAGNPELNAHIGGTNEFAPGDDLSLPVVIENTGLNQFMIVESGIISPGDLSNTAERKTN